jgi:hypothetical protein
MALPYYVCSTLLRSWNLAWVAACASSRAEYRWAETLNFQEENCIFFPPRNWLAHLRAVNHDNRSAMHGTLYSLHRYRGSNPVEIYTGSSVKQTLSIMSRFCTLTSYGISIHLYYRCDRLADVIEKKYGLNSAQLGQRYAYPPLPSETTVRCR